MSKTPADYLEESAAIYRQRNEVYGDNYKHVGKAFSALFPRGLRIEPGDEETFNRLMFIMHMYSKLSRYAWNIQKGGHNDSLADIAVYACLALECDEAAAGKDAA